MIVFCEDCGGRNDVDAEKIQNKEPVRCSICHELLRVQMPLEPLPHLVKKDEDGAGGPDSPPKGTSLDLRMGERTLTVSQTRPTITMGRQEHNDLEVIDTRVSRSHARVEFRDGVFFLIDHSTNGTYVEMEGQEGINLKRSEVALEGKGIIALGRKITADSPKAIHYTLIP